MIKIEKIEIREFRGIRELTLWPKGQNFAACGPNGTGKSGIVDAIEFALTGNISRLSGTGTGALSVKTHGPHVDSRDKPAAASVTLDVIIPSLKDKRAQISRTVNTANTSNITPADPDVLAAFAKIKQHPEFVLSRRELIRYVLSEPGERSKEVQSLLRLDNIEKLRATLQKISNAATKEADTLERVEAGAETALKTAIGASSLTKAALLDAINPRRELLGLPPLADLDATTSVKEGLGAVASRPVGRVPKAEAGADLASLKTFVGKLQDAEFQRVCTEVAVSAAALAEDAASLESVSREALLKSALELYDEKSCPVCDTPFEPETFRGHLATKLGRYDDAAKRRAKLEADLQPILDAIHAVEAALCTIIAYAGQFSPRIDAAQLVEYRATLLETYKQLQKLLPLPDTCAVLASAHVVPNLDKTLEAVMVAIAAIPEPTKQDAAREFLVLVQERLQRYQNAKREATAGRRRATRAAKVLSIYGEVITTALNAIYKDVESAFAGYYRTINEDDENAFTAKLTPSLGKLGFDVDFYGRGHFPPGAYHSEGHQDGMGLCLYLALMDHLLGGSFTVAVLDDVLMSVDAGHRRQVCKLIKERFPNTQFIFTTHDEIWLRHMKSEGLVKGRSFAHFRKWNVDLGPTEWDNRDVWSELENLLASGDVRATSGLLRHYLEYFAREACDRLHATVQFRGNAQYSLGDLLPSAVAAMGDLLKKAKAAANSWNQKDLIERIALLEAEFSGKKLKVEYDKWQVNAAVHFNEWADFRREDFVPVVAAFRALTSSYSCERCEEMYFVVEMPERRKKEALRCGCGTLNLNLLAKGS